MRVIVRNFDKIIIAFFVYSLVFPSIRIALIGADKFKNWGEFFFTASPDILNVIIALFALYIFITGTSNYKKLTILDWIFLAYFVLTLAWGIYLSQNVFLFASGIRITYIPMLFYIVGRAFPITVTEDTQDAVYNKINKLIDGVFFCFLLLAVIGIGIYFIAPDLQERIIAYTNHEATAYFIIRMTSILWTPVVFGFLMGITSLFYYYKIVANGHKKFYLFLSITWLALMLSVCRGGIIAFIMGFIITTLLFRQWRKAVITFTIIAVISCAISLIMVGSFKMVIWIFASSSDTMQMTSGVTRVSLWQESIKSLAKRPGGYGLGKAGWTAFEYLKDSTDAAPYTTDGWYLKTACEIGIFGLAGYLIMTAAFFLNIFKFVRHNSATFVSLSLAIIVMVHFQNIVSNVLDFHPYIGLYWLLLGLSQAVIVQNKNAAHH